MRLLLTGFAVAATLVASLIGTLDTRDIPVAAACGGRYEDDCDFDALDRPDRPEEEEVYPADEELTDEELKDRKIQGQHDAWADAHLAAEKAAATWWRSGRPTLSFYAQLFYPEEAVREGSLMEQNREGTLEYAPYFAGGRYSTIQDDDTFTYTTQLADGTWVTQLRDGTPATLGPGRDFVRYVCDLNYDDAESGGCVPNDRDYDCAELRSWGIASIPVIGEDWMLLDDDGDGRGCEPVFTPSQVVQAVAPTPESADDCDGVVGRMGCFLFGP